LEYIAEPDHFSHLGGGNSAVARHLAILRACKVLAKVNITTTINKEGEKREVALSS